MKKSLMKFNKCKELHIVVEARGRPAGKQLCIMDLSVLVDKKLNISQQYALVGMKVNCIVAHNSKN